MTKDVIALTPSMPDPTTLLAGLYAGGPDLTVNTLAEGMVLQLRTPEGAPLLSVEAPQLVHHPDEVHRLLGPQVPLPEGPFWWTEVRATGALPEAERLAASFAGRLTSVLGGAVWPPGTAHTDVVALPSPLTLRPVPDHQPPAVDIQTDRASVVVQDRPVTALTTWLSSALAETTAQGRALQLVTPPMSRLTLPVRAALAFGPHRWVVQHPETGYYDGLRGARLQWSDGAFTEERGPDGASVVAETFTAPADAATPEGERQLALSLQTVHPATADLVLGGALEAAWQHLTGARPTGWGTAEPVHLPWSKRELTDLARTRAQKGAPTFFITLGAREQPAIATTRVLHTPAGIEEHTTLVLGYRSDDTVPPDTALSELARHLTARHNLATLFVTVRPARRDLTAAPHAEHSPAPVTAPSAPGSAGALGHRYRSR
ncbi:hypothetical protein DT019_09055 [Streptomyces sp. SDr-06]|uniref:DUF6177 family protein n=1 Tax=Streptomyces sp. SDr-06 TaxID=2267702 RepID=UPI000DE906E8|nr:DUF6177 family protein [Streptomyces sp. SDr-06]RCH68800.1 hypothetical protein DT019_09055 [Streptomyces sp. SDr-06]